MNLYFDCEFTGLRKDTTLISIGIVAENGRRFYAELCDYDRGQCDDWILQNVISSLFLPKLMREGEALEFGIGNARKGKKVWIPPDRPYIDFFVTANKEELHEKAAYIFNAIEDENGNRNVFGNKDWVTKHLKEWISKFDSVQFVSDVCHYDFVLLIDLFGSAWDLPQNVSPVCHDINTEIARHYGISEAEAFDKSREEIVKELCGHEIEGRKHNALYDAEVIKSIYNKINNIRNW